MKNKKIYLLILIISIIFIAPLIRFNTYIWGHDSFFHISNIIALKESFLSGNWLFPKVYPIIARGFGYATGIFYNPIPHLSLSFLSYILPMLSVLSILKIAHLVTIFFSMLFMYQFVYKITKRDYISLLAAVLYISFPYFLTDIYVRDALAESLSFVFIPLLFNGLYELLYLNNSSKFYILFVSSAVGLILTHTITTFYISLFSFLFLLLNLKKVLKKENIKSFIIAFVFIIGMSIFYLVPIIEQKIYADINIFNGASTFSGQSVFNYALSLFSLLPFNNSKSPDGIQFFILIPMIFLIIFSIFKYKDCKLPNKKIFLDFLIIGSIALFMTTDLFPWSKMPNIMLYIQFPWRLLLLVDFFLSPFAILCLLDIKEEYKNYLSIGLIILVTASSLEMLNLEKVTSFTTNDVDVSTMGIGAVNDYLPTKVINNYDYYLNRSEDIKILKGKGTVDIEYYKAPYIKFNATLDSEEMVLELPLLYYYGYSCIDPGIKNIKESPNGFVELTINKNNNYTVNYTGSKFYGISINISLLTLLAYIIYIQKRSE